MASRAAISYVLQTVGGRVPDRQGGGGCFFEDRKAPASIPYESNYLRSVLNPGTCFLREIA